MIGEVQVAHMNPNPQHGHLYTNGQGGQVGPVVDDDLPEAETSIMACDYVKWRLGQSGYNWEECPELPDPNRIRLTLRIVAEEFETNYNQQMNQMVQEVEITPQTAFPRFMGICEGIFEDGNVNWGRIVALYAFGGALAVHCVQNEMPQLVGNVADWIAVFCDARLSDWVQSNGGWDGLVEFYEMRQAQRTNWPAWKQVAAVGIGVVGAGVALGRMLSG